MRIKPPVLSTVAVAAAVVLFLVMVAEAMARGPGGGRGGGPRGGHRVGRVHHNRMGPASGGNFSSRRMHRPTTRSGSTYRPHMRGAPRPTPARRLPPPAAAPPETRPGDRQQMQERIDERHDAMLETREHRREKTRDEHWDDYRRRRDRVALGTAFTSADWNGDDCEASVVVDGITYYNCDGIWYRQAYAGGEVTYVVVEGPRSD